jgi:hypothetical protein
VTEERNGNGELFLVVAVDDAHHPVAAVEHAFVVGDHHGGPVMIMHLPGDQFDHSAAPHPIEAGGQRPPIRHLRGQESGRIGAEQNAAELLLTLQPSKKT